MRHTQGWIALLLMAYAVLLPSIARSQSPAAPDVLFRAEGYIYHDNLWGADYPVRWQGNNAFFGPTIDWNKTWDGGFRRASSEGSASNGTLNATIRTHIALQVSGLVWRGMGTSNTFSAFVKGLPGTMYSLTRTYSGSINVTKTYWAGVDGRFRDFYLNDTGSRPISDHKVVQSASATDGPYYFPEYPGVPYCRVYNEAADAVGQVIQDWNVPEGPQSSEVTANVSLSVAMEFSALRFSPDSISGFAGDYAL